MGEPIISAERLNTLEEEFRASGKDIDTFLRDKVNESGRPDADKVASDIIATFASIDANYADLRKAKEEGRNRTDWLNDKFRNLFKAVNPKTAGELLSRITNALRGKPDAPAADVEFSGFDARELTQKLSDALEAVEVRQLNNAYDQTISSEEK